MGTPNSSKSIFIFGHMKINDFQEEAEKKNRIKTAFFIQNLLHQGFFFKKFNVAYNKTTRHLSSTL